MTFLRVDGYEEDLAVFRTWGDIGIRKFVTFSILLCCFFLKINVLLKSCGLVPLTSVKRATIFGTTEVGQCHLATPIGDLTRPITGEITKIAFITACTISLGTIGIVQPCTVEYANPSLNRFWSAIS